MYIENPMSQQRLLDAVEVMNWLTKQAVDLPEARNLAAPMGAVLAAANLYLILYVKNLAHGAEPYDALVAASFHGPSLDSFLERMEF